MIFNPLFRKGKLNIPTKPSKKRNRSYKIRGERATFALIFREGLINKLSQRVLKKNVRMRSILLIFSYIILTATVAVAHDHDGHEHDHATEQHEGHDHENGDHDHHHGGHDHGDHMACGHPTHHEFDAGATAFHHIADANVYSIGPWSFPLPCILYAPDGNGLQTFMSSKFGDRDTHGTGNKAYKGYVLDQGTVVRVKDNNFPQEQVDIAGIVHLQEKDAKGKEKNVPHVCYNDQLYKCDKKSTADAGLFGGGITSYYDLSITKNVLSMFIVCFLLGWLFLSVAKSYRNRRGQAPKGVQSLIESIVVFVRDECAKPFLGHKYMKFLPYLLAIFFFILGLNLWGQIPFLGGSNVTGNLGVTMVLAIIAFIVTNLNGNKHYWEHVFWMPGVPAWVKTIITPVEIAGLFIKPLTLMLRLFANITAGHMVIIIFVSLIFILGDVGNNAGVAWGTSIGSVLLTLFMMAIELLVAFIQAFVFTLLTASYIGAATEEAHH